MSEPKFCYQRCKWFRCGKKALFNSRNTAWCNWTEEECKIASCSYATCVKRKLLPRGICGETVKRKTVERGPEDLTIPAVRLKGKALRKVGEKEIF